MLECMLCICFVLTTVCYMITTYKNIQHLERGNRTHADLYLVLKRKIEMEADKLRLEIKCKTEK